MGRVDLTVDSNHETKMKRWPARILCSGLHCRGQSRGGRDGAEIRLAGFSRVVEGKKGHPATEKRDRDHAEQQLERLSEVLAPEELADARDRAGALKLEEVVQDLLGSSLGIEAADGKS